MTENEDPVKRPRGRPRKPRPENPEPPRPRGRPSLGDNARTQNVTIRFTQDELEALKRLAAEEGVPLADFIVTPMWNSLKRRGIKL